MLIKLSEIAPMPNNELVEYQRAYLQHAGMPAADMRDDEVARAFEEHTGAAALAKDIGAAATYAIE